MPGPKYRVAIIHDVEQTTEDGTPIRWAYANRSWALQQYAPPDFYVERMSHRKTRWNRIKEFDLVYALDYSLAQSYRHEWSKYRFGVPLVISFNKDSNSRHDEYRTTVQSADWVVINNEERYLADGVQDKTCCISNGVDTQFWKVSRSIMSRPLRVLWAGSSGPAKLKGYAEILQPLEKILSNAGFECDFRPINDFRPGLVFTPEEQRDWYNGGAYYLNASQTEGTPSSALEAMACGCVYVSTNVGNVREFGRDGENCRIVDRTVDAFANAICDVEQTGRRYEIARAGEMEMNYEWAYGPPARRADVFFALFRSIIEVGTRKLLPFSYRDVDSDELAGNGGFIHKLGIGQLETETLPCVPKRRPR